jgi:2-dehydro-3-deoxygluconokinase
MVADLLCLGEPMVEYNQRAGDDFLRGHGGDVSNVAVAAARQGARAGMVASLGDDGHGRLFRDLWTAEGVDASLVRVDPAAPTGVYFVSHGPDGHRFDFLRKGSAASRLGPADLPLDAIGRCCILHLSAISLAISDAACDAGFAAMRAARAGGARVSFDCNLRRQLWGLDRARAVVAEALRHCDIALPSVDDLAALIGTDDPDAQAAFCRDRGAAVIAVKRGALGARVYRDGGAVDIPAHPVQPIDATGAGDCFDGAFLARLLAGDAPEAAASYAAVAAALSTTGYGAVAPIPRATTVRAALQAAVADRGARPA